MRLGQTTIINHRIGDGLVRTFSVTQGPISLVTAHAERGASTYYSAQYSITLDVVNTSPKASDIRLVVGFSGNQRAEAGTGRLEPGKHRLVTVPINWSERTPEDLFLRESD